MPENARFQNQIWKNLLIIRAVLAAVLTTLVLYHLKTAGAWSWVFLGALAVSFIPFFTSKTETFEHVQTQYTIFSLDLVFILSGLFLADRLETEFLLSFFLTLFISALSRSVTNSILVAVAVNALYLYRVYWVKPDFSPYDPNLLLECCLLLMAALHSGFLAFRTIEEETHLVEMARRMKLLDQKVKEGSQTALEYAATLKKVLDSLPLGAVAVGRSGEILFVNQPAAKLLEITNARVLQGNSIAHPKLGEIGKRMEQSIKEKNEMHRVYLDLEWGGRNRRFRIDSKEGASEGTPWGTLFLLQEAPVSTPETTPQVS